MYRIIAYTNACVSNWNNYIRNNIIKDANKSIITKNDLIMSYETIVNEFMEIIINNSEEYIINDIVNFVDDTYGFSFVLDYLGTDKSFLEIGVDDSCTLGGFPSFTIGPGFYFHFSGGDEGFQFQQVISRFDQTVYT